MNNGQISQAVSGYFKYKNFAGEIDERIVNNIKY